MNQISLLAVDKFFNTYEKIKNGELPCSEFKDLFQELANYDYRNEYEKKIDYYIEIFAGGAIRELKVDTDNSGRYKKAETKKVTDVAYYCKLFLKEHFIHVRKPFWPKYKKYYKNKFAVISPSKIMNFITTIEGVKSGSKNKKKAN